MRIVNPRIYRHFSGPTDRRRIETSSWRGLSALSLISPVPQTGDGLKLAVPPPPGPGRRISPVPQTGDGLKLDSASSSPPSPNFSGPTDRRRIETRRSSGCGAWEANFSGPTDRRRIETAGPDSRTSPSAFLRSHRPETD